MISWESLVFSWVSSTTLSSWILSFFDKDSISDFWKPEYLLASLSFFSMRDFWADISSSLFFQALESLSASTLQDLRSSISSFSSLIFTQYSLSFFINKSWKLLASWSFFSTSSSLFFKALMSLFDWTFSDLRLSMYSLRLETSLHFESMSDFDSFMILDFSEICFIKALFLDCNSVSFFIQSLLSSSFSTERNSILFWRVNLLWSASAWLALRAESCFSKLWILASVSALCLANCSSRHRLSFSSVSIVFKCASFSWNISSIVLLKSSSLTALWLSKVSILFSKVCFSWSQSSPMASVLILFSTYSPLFSLLLSSTFLLNSSILKKSLRASLENDSDRDISLSLKHICKWILHSKI